MRDQAGIVFIGIVVACLGAWATHIVWVILKLSSDLGITVGQAVLGVIGSFIPPIGVIHGFMIWFGFGLG